MGGGIVFLGETGRVSDTRKKRKLSRCFMGSFKEESCWGRRLSGSMLPSSVRKGEEAEVNLNGNLSHVRKVLR